jgi:predicted nucleic-acid-binding protein
MIALDTNVVVRFLVNDDEVQGRKVRALFDSAEKTGESLFVTVPVLLELMWVLSAVYDFTRDEVIEALELLAEMPIPRLENFSAVQKLIQLGRLTRADLPDLLIGLTGQVHGCEYTLTFEKGLSRTGLFEHL